MLESFIGWIKNINEVWGSSWKYEVPEDKEQQLYDFYMIESLLPPGVMLYLKPFDFGHDNPPTGYWEHPREDQVYYAIYEAAGKLIPTLKKNLLDAVLFSIMSELRHVLDVYVDDYSGSHYAGEGKEGIRGLAKRVRKEFDPETENMFKNYIKNMVLHTRPETAAFMRRKKVPEDLKSSHESRRASFQAMLKSGGTPEKWVELARHLFQHEQWNVSFGGPAWADIAEGWLKLYKASALGHQIAAIDRIYDLQHNTDTVFNKVESYLKDGGYDWLRAALDHKRYIQSPYEIIDKVSPWMKILAKKAMWVIKGVSWAEFQDKKEDYDKQRQAAIHQKYYGSPPKEPEVEEPEVHDPAKDYVTLKSPSLSYYPWYVSVARIAYRVPMSFSASDEERVKKVMQYMELDTSETNIDKAVGQLERERHNDQYYAEKVSITGPVAEFIAKQEAINLLAQHFHDAPQVILDPYDFDAVINYLKQGTHNGIENARIKLSQATNYTPTALDSLRYYIFLKAVAEDKFGEEWAKQGYEKQQAALKEKLTTAWLPVSSSSLPIETKLARVLRLTNYEWKKIKPDDLMAAVKVLNLPMGVLQKKQAWDIFQKERQMEEYFDKHLVTSVYDATDRPTVYKLLETHFPNAPQIKLDPKIEKELEALILNKNKKISAIKLFREQTGWGLRASKDYVEYLQLEMIYLGAKVA